MTEERIRAHAVALNADDHLSSEDGKPRARRSSSESEICEEWLSECSRRAQDFDEGRVQPVAAEDVRRRAQALLK